MFTKRLRIINNYYITMEEHWFDLKPHDYLQKILQCKNATSLNQDSGAYMYFGG